MPCSRSQLPETRTLPAVAFKVGTATSAVATVLSVWVTDDKTCVIIEKSDAIYLT